MKILGLGKCGLVRLLVCLGAFTVSGVAVAAGPPTDSSATTLANGLVVTVLENRARPLVTLELVLRMGSFSEAPDETGLTTLHEQMFFKAHRDYPGAADFALRARQLGIVWGSRLADEYVSTFFTLPADSLRAGLEFLWHGIRYPLALSNELEDAQRLVLTDLAGRESDPEHHLQRAVLKQLWGAAYRVKNPSGDPEAIAGATAEQLRLYQLTRVLPGNAALVIAGDIAAEEGLLLAEEIFGRWEEGVAGPRSAVPDLPQPTVMKDTVVVQPVHKARIVVAWQSPVVGSDRVGVLAARVFAAILALPTSSLTTNLISKGIVTEAGLEVSERRYGAPLLLTFSCRPENFWDAYQAIFTEIDRFGLPNYFSDRQLAAAKARLEAEVREDERQAWIQAQLAAGQWAVGGLDYRDLYRVGLREITGTDVLRFIQRYIHGRPHVRVVMVDRQTRQEQGISRERLR